MTSEDESIVEDFESGEYFEEARKWYNVLYIGPISERIFFIIITSISLCVFIMAFLALAYLLPLAPRIPFVYYNKDIVEDIPKMIRFKQPDEPSNPALIKYYLRTYVQMRESYSESKFLVNRSFMKYYSDERSYAEYDRLTHPTNPRSPIRRYGKFVDVEVTVDSVTYERPQLGTPKATVNFSTEVISAESRKKSNWTASIGFYYTDLIERDVIDPETGEISLDFDEPTFQVVSYDVRERLAAPIKDE
ncbi:MAG: type IV secretion system protein [Rickettsiales bacterium]|nr:type IV secretion system protein [Rickettsiales bacterium]